MHIWWIGALIVFFVTLLLAYASWIFVESPALKRKKAVSNWAHRRIESIMLPRRTCDPVRTAAGEQKEYLRVEL